MSAETGLSLKTGGSRVTAFCSAVLDEFQSEAVRLVAPNVKDLHCFDLRLDQPPSHLPGEMGLFRMATWVDAAMHLPSSTSMAKLTPADAGSCQP
jgi:hypothetical protein